ncbi:hypothetical protein BDV24DRAFT_173014 [Aspergillus arachidicola]|uniref:Elongation factor 2 kinase n=1 Tax=Aspergillus arachidicola TaxID=656916 RepID=A0A2G7FPM8_9EURO|nr:hypothetical protein BDV24DRAFT_173014 [Aspergillus arachidicola]PIG82489.1 elongation factor 2 kinase [Aspergillus arachidicola]
MLRTCAACGRSLYQSSYTANQFSEGPGVSRCASCVHGHHADTVSAGQSDSGRYNNSNKGSVPTSALENPFAQGAFRWVAKGSYTSGSRSGEACVVKWFKTGAVFSDDYFTLDIKAVDKALEIVNSNTGWNDDSRTWGEVMQALSHFSYHISGGNYVLCDLQGGIYQHELVLSDPVILSRTREYGVTDLGLDGISSFFSQHVCNDFCRPNWTQPANPVQSFRPVHGTTMIRHTVPTGYSRPRETSLFA